MPLNIVRTLHSSSDEVITLYDLEKHLSEMLVELASGKKRVNFLGSSNNYQYYLLRLMLVQLEIARRIGDKNSERELLAQLY